jgi:hypothetical protein
MVQQQGSRRMTRKKAIAPQQNGAKSKAPWQYGMIE